MKNENLDAPQMTDEEMDQVLSEFAGTIAYQALLRFVRIRDLVVDNSLRSLDPFKQPTEIARNQGIGIGLQDFPGYIESLKRKVAEREAADTKH